MILQSMLGLLSKKVLFLFSSCEARRWLQKIDFKLKIIDFTLENGIFSFIQEIAMDLGTANTIIISDDKIVVDEPSVVALDRRTDKMIAVGEKAKMMYEKTHDNIRTIRPLRDGVIADFTACEQMMRGLIKMVHTGSRLFSPSLRMVIGVPSGSTEVELRAVRDSAEHADGRDVYLILSQWLQLSVSVSM